MHGKKEDTLPFVALNLINEPSLLPFVPPGEPGEEEHDSWDDQIDPFERRYLPTSMEAAPI